MKSGLIAFFVSTIMASAVWAWADYKWVGAFVGLAGVVGLIGTLLSLKTPAPWPKANDQGWGEGDDVRDVALPMLKICP
jgi:hypothetical protein